MYTGKKKKERDSLSWQRSWEKAKLPEFKIGMSTSNPLFTLQKHQQKLPILPVKREDNLLVTWLLSFFQF